MVASLALPRHGKNNKNLNKIMSTNAEKIEISLNQFCRIQFFTLSGLFDLTRKLLPI